jgi:lipid-A-disaccharide synthase
VTARLLVVAGEASGDRAGAAVVARLRERIDVRVLGMGGAALEAAGGSLLADLRESTAMGLGAVAGRAGSILLGAARILAAARTERVKAALLVNYSDFNARLAPLLRRMGVRTLWYGAPQVWAWRPGRAPSLARTIDRMAVTLPFEEAIWRNAGVATDYVGHPALEVTPLSRTEARDALGLTRRAQTIAVMPGSRPHEVRALLRPMLAAVAILRVDRASIDARVLVASSLDRRTRDAVRRQAAAAGVGTYDVSATHGAGLVLPAFDAALTASGTAALEAALARAVPVVAYKVGIATEVVARLLVRTEHYALPNVLLGRRAFPELLQRDATPPVLAAALARSLDAPAELLLACDAVRATLGERSAPSREVATLLLPWLSDASSPAR